jgi:hypothetical protein
VADVPNGLSLTPPRRKLKKIKPEDEDSTSSETWVNIYQNLRRNIPEDSNLHCYNLGILKSHHFDLDVRAALISVG